MGGGVEMKTSVKDEEPQHKRKHRQKRESESVQDRDRAIDKAKMRIENPTLD